MSSRSSPVAMDLRSWLIAEARFPPDKLDPLLSLLSAHWVEDVATLRACIDGLEKHLPAAAFVRMKQALGVAVERPSEAPASPPAPPPPGGFSAAQKLGPSFSPRRTPTATMTMTLSSAQSSGRAVSTKSIALADVGRQEEQARERKASFARSTKRYRQQLDRMQRFTLHPESTFLRWWELVTVVALAFTATATPFELGFLRVGLDPLFFVNRFVDAFYLLDVVVQFFVPFRSSNAEGGLWVYSSSRIMCRYLSTWFLIDVLTSAPCDAVFFALEEYGIISYSRYQLSTHLRWIRMGKMLRLGRVFTLAARWDVHLNLSSVAKEGIRTLCTLLVACHWLACLWAYVGRYGGDGTLQPGAAASLRSRSWIEQAGAVDLAASPVKLYGLCLNVAVASVFGGAGGNVGSTSPANWVESYVQSAMLLVGAGLWLVVLARIVGVVATSSGGATRRRQAMDELQHFVSEKGIPRPLARRLRTFYHQAGHLHRSQAHEALMLGMSKGLRSEAATHVAHGALSSVSYLNNVGSACLAELAMGLRSQMVAPRELISVECLTVLDRGVGAKRGRILLRGDALGVDVIISTRAFRDLQPAAALSFVQTLTLTKGTIDTALLRHPTARAAVRKAACWMALRRAVLSAAAYVAGQHAHFGSGSPAPSRLSAVEMLQRVKASAPPPATDDATQRGSGRSGGDGSLGGDGDGGGSGVNVNDRLCAIESTVATLASVMRQQLEQISASVATVAMNTADAYVEPEPTPLRRLRLNRPKCGAPTPAAATAPLYQERPPPYRGAATPATQAAPGASPAGGAAAVPSGAGSRQCSWMARTSVPAEGRASAGEGLSA